MTTLVQDDAVRATARRAGYTLDDRADMLRRLAENWDHHILTYERRKLAGDPWVSCLSADQIVDGLTLAAAEYAAPDMPLHEIRSYMEALRDDLHRLREWECDGIWDGEPTDTDQMILNYLNGEVDAALWPLLTGMALSNCCHTCTRLVADPVNWSVRVAGSGTCERHP